jgi:CHAT domain-containing protein
MNDVPRHPEAQVMAAFVDGTLAPNEIAAVANHLRDCSDCRTVVSETARFEREEESAARPRRNVWWLAAAAVIVAIIIAVPMLRPRTPIGRLIAASPREHRTIEARLSGFPWARLAAPARGDAPPDPADLKLIGAAGYVLAKTTSDRTPEARHAAGVADLFIDRRSDSIAALEQAASASNDPRIWSDLAAARYAYAVRDEHLSQLPEALADADHALRIDPKSPEALFNRALIIEALGLREQARKAWQKYLEIDPGSGWAVEARERLRRLDTHARRFDRRLLEELPADQLVREFPQEARTWGEVPLLSEWADAASANSGGLAEERLDRLRAVGQSLARFNGDRRLEDAVAAIDRASPVERAAIIEAHRTYRAARLDYNNSRASEADSKFRRAAALFATAKSPLAQVARYYAASVAVFQNRGGEACDELHDLLSHLDRKRYPSVEADLRWELAVAANIAGDWGAAVREADSASKIFVSLGERARAAEVDVVAAHALDLIGNSDLAWQRRVHALENLDETRADRRAAILYSSAEVLRSIDRESAAAAVLQLMIDDGPGSPPFLVTLAHLDRAQLLGRSDEPAAHRELSEARASALRIADPARQETATVQITVTDAALRPASDGRLAVAELNRAAEFFKLRHLHALLPDVYLKRAHAWQATNDERAASADYALALEEIERQRTTIDDPNLRARFLDIASQIVTGSIDLHLSSGDVAQAFAIADRAKGSESRATRTSGDVGIVEYTVLPHAVAIFSLVGGSIAADKVAVEHTDLDTLVSSFVESIRRRAPKAQVDRDGAALYGLLIEPARKRLAGLGELIVIPDRQLNAVPFAALYDPKRERYLVEDFTIGFAPNASPAAGVAPLLRPAIVFADPTTPDASRLAASRSEAAQIASMYDATLFVGNEATRDRFLAEAPHAAMIHYAGHADSDAATFGAIRLAASGPDLGMFSSPEIARLPLGRHPLVVLAACGTFRGDPMHVAGMSSIARAFLDAGARAVAGTLWEIDDDLAAEFFRRFHERLRLGRLPAPALRDVQLEMLRSADARLRHPATWAPIELLAHIDTHSQEGE